jgi:drug/metabolite transporter (DMT)-like permease
MQLNSRTKGIILVFFSTMLWGISGTVAQFLFQQKDFNPEWLVVVRLLISGFILLIYGYIKGDHNIKKVWKSKNDAIKLILFAIMGMLGVQYTYFAAIKHGNAATATILQYLSPIIITFYLSISKKKLTNIKQLISILLAIIGTFFIITSGNINSLSLSKLALFWGICSAFCTAIYTLQPVYLLKKYSSISIVGWGMLVAGLAFSFIHSPFNIIGELSTSSIIGVIFIVIFGTLIAFYCYLESLNYLMPTESSILSCIEPLSATFLSVLWLNTQFGLPEFIGTFCILTTVIILSFSNQN